MRGSKHLTGRAGTSFVGGLLFGSLFVNSVTAVTLTGPDYAQDFDSLAGSGTTGTLVPLDWAISEVPTSTPLSYGVSTGSATTGNTYSFGAAGSPDRALGG